MVPEGLITRGDSLILLGKVNPNLCSETGSMDAAQVFVSNDEGKTWDKKGPALDGSEYTRFLDNGTELWIAGEHVAEGPSGDPFVVRYRANDRWRIHTIYSGNAALLAIAQGRTRTLSAWVRHIDFKSHDWTKGPIYRHTSSDQGITWKAAKVRSVPAEYPGLTFFKKIEKPGGTWRIADLGDQGFAVQHRAADGTWQVVSTFPLPTCTQ